MLTSSKMGQDFLAQVEARPGFVLLKANGELDLVGDLVVLVLKDRVFVLVAPLEESHQGAAGLAAVQLRLTKVDLGVEVLVGV